MRSNHHRHHHHHHEHNRRSYGSPPPPPSTSSSLSSRQISSMVPPPPQGTMIINLKTTVTTSGGQHNGLVVHSAIQSNGSGSSNSNNWMSTPYVESPNGGRIEMLTSNSSLHRIGSPLPIQMVPSTSRETLISKKDHRDSRTSSPGINVRSNSSHHIPLHPPPSPPSSPIYSFKGRNSPPDEFIQPTKLVLNIFQPTHREPTWQTTIPRSYTSEQIENDEGGISLSKKNALLNDSVTTTTTVEVFRAPFDETPVIGLPSSPYGGDPLLIRTHGSNPYEKWTNSKTQTMINDEAPIDGNYFDKNNDGITFHGAIKGVQWKDSLVEKARYSDNSDYEEIEPMPHPDAPTINAPQFINNDYRPKNVQQFQPISHPILSNSRDNLSINQHSPSYNRMDYQSNFGGKNQLMSPLYVVPDRKSIKNDQTTYKKQEEKYHRRAKSSSRDDVQRSRNVRHRSMSPAAQRSRNEGSQEELLMENVIDELEMISSPLAESEDSLISEMSTKYDVTKSSWLEIRNGLCKNDSKLTEDDDEKEIIYGSPNFNDSKSHFYRKRGELDLRKSKTTDRPKPPRPRTPESKFGRNSRNLIDKKQMEAIYAKPMKQKKKEIEEFDIIPRYVKKEEIQLMNSTTKPFLTDQNEINSKVEKIEEKLKKLKFVREDSLTNLLKKELSKKLVANEAKEETKTELPEYVEPKDPIIRELQEFLKIKPDFKKKEEELEKGYEEDEEDDGDETIRDETKSVQNRENLLQHGRIEQFNEDFSFSTTSSSSSTAV